MRKILILALAGMLAGGVAAKKQLDHSSFDDWKSVTNYGLSRNGVWEAYAVNPQEGDGVLYIYNTRTRKSLEIARGSGLRFTADSKWAAAKIAPLYKDTRNAKIKKKKDFDLPQDSLAIINLEKMSVEKIPNLINWKIGKEGGEWIAYQSSDTAYIKPKALKDKKAGKPLVLRNLASGVQKVVNWVDSYVVSENGKRVGLTIRKCKSDSLSTDGVGVITLPDTSLTIIDRDRKYYGTPVFDKAGDSMAYTWSEDSLESGTRKCSLMLVDLSEKIAEPKELTVTLSERQPVNLMPAHSDNPDEQKRLDEQRREAIRKSMGEELFINQYSKVLFSNNGKRLVVGVAPQIAPDDTTIVDFERADLDIWRWDAPYTPPQENKKVDKLRKHTYPVVIDLADGSYRLLTSNPLVEVVAPDRWDGDWALLRDPSKTIVSYQWDYYAPTDIRVVNVNTGEVKNVGTIYREDGELSPADKYVFWWKDRNYYCYNIATGTTVNVSEKVEYPLWDEENDVPGEALPYGVAGWAEDDSAFLVYDRHDIWSLDPDGKREPVCLTAGDGRKRNLRFRYVKTDPEQRFISRGDKMLLSVFDYVDKRNGLALTTYGKPAAPAVKLLDTYSFTQIKKALKADVYSWQKANFNTSPDIWLSVGNDFAKAVRLSDANPQMKDYSWGDARLVKWTTYDGSEAEGVLYVPEDYDPEKKYPMLAVFYERNSEELYRHYTMEPSWSWVNYPFYVSRGYVVFVPDIRYKAGVPGECAYNYVCSGVEEMCRRYPWIDKERIGIDGQSWGGYQTAYLITRTDMFACAGSGAPVANMTSAFGGIRWESGDSRQAQYEMGQSRIGRNLWEAPQLYIANSPVFYADRVKTPLLIMHNDADGAVPWYQGIEMFMALRRLEKPVWMLQYNGEAHNIRARKNRKDITVRLQQFFDHYLKGDPMPKWMKEGIPAVRKGQEMGY